MSNYSTEIQNLVNFIKQSNNIVVLTGAGISTASGIPDFRSNGGFYSSGISREELMSKYTFQNYPKKFWKYYKEIFEIKLMNDFEPNFGHSFLVELEKMGKNVNIITQNVDGLHKKVGSSSVYEIHGNINGGNCIKCGFEYDLDYINSVDTPKCNKVIPKFNTCNNFLITSNKDIEKGYMVCDSCDYIHVISTFEDSKYAGKSKRCKNIKEDTLKCNGYLKPNVVLFGDDIKYWNNAEEIVSEADLLLVLGTSLKVSPFNQLILPYYSSTSKKVIINNESTVFDHVFDEVINDGIVDTLKVVYDLI